MKLWCNILLTLLITVALCRAQDSTGATLKVLNQVWFKYEMVENGKIHETTREEGVENSTGFSINKLRLMYGGSITDTPFFFLISVDVDKQLRLMDCYLGIEFYPLLKVLVGQMKIPSTYEVMQLRENNDFVNHSQISSKICDWSLVRTPYIGNYQNIKSYNRDMGISLKGNYEENIFEYQLMISNGFGADYFSGGYEKHEAGDVFANNLGDFFYGLRIDYQPVDLVKLGGFYSRNKHDNYIVNDIRYGIVRHLDRKSYSVDCKINLPFNSRAHCLYAGGKIGDNYFNDRTRVDQNALEYEGVECKILSRYPWYCIESGIRFDRYIYKYNEQNFEYRDDQWTFGLTYFYKDKIKIQCNYIYKDYEGQYARGLNDDLFVINVQYNYKTILY